jgi:hypothetical protein
VGDVGRLKDDGIIGHQRLDAGDQLGVKAGKEVAMPLVIVAIVKMTSVVVPPELSKPFPELDVPGVMCKTLGLETNGLTYAPLGWRASGCTSWGCRACSCCVCRRRGRSELGLFPLLGIIHDPGVAELNVAEQGRNIVAPGQVMLAVLRRQFAHLPDDFVHVVAVDLQLLESRARKSQGILRRWMARFEQCVQLTTESAFVTSKPTLMSSKGANQLLDVGLDIASGSHGYSDSTRKL